MSEAAAATDESPGLSQIERAVDTFVEPSKTFADIKRSRSWWLPFLVISLLGYVFIFAAMQHIGMDTITDNVIKNNPRSAARLSTQTPEQQAQTLSFTKTIMQVSFAGLPVWVLVTNALLALLLWVGFSFVLGGTTNYREMFVVSIFASLPTALGSLISTVVVFVADPQHYNISTPSPANLGFYLDAEAAAWVRSLLGSIDAFWLWSLALAAFGAAIVAKVKPIRGFILVFSAWAIYVLIKTGIAAL
jgi:hypothetical protein